MDRLFNAKIITGSNKEFKLMPKKIKQTRYLIRHNIYTPTHNSVYNQLLGIKLRSVSPWVALVYLDTEFLWQRK
jgi:hypothetical protein